MVNNKIKKQIVLSSDNKNKIREIKEIIKDLPIEILSKKDIGCQDLEVDEKYDTLEENALVKAESIKRYTKNAVIADDTGLFVEELGGEPGVHSARYSGDHDDQANRNKLLSKLKDSKDRSAYFKTIIVYIGEDGKKEYFEGICKGYITREERGENGVGYDSIFQAEGYNKTFAEMTDDEKNFISHRRKAIEKLEEFLKKQI